MRALDLAKFLVVGVSCVVAGAEELQNVAPGVQKIGRLAHPGLTESSGIVASRQYPGVFWTHSDGGGQGQVLYAVNRAGESLGHYLVTGARFQDWEDIASDGEGHLWLADSGNNDLRRREFVVHQVNEPSPTNSPGATVPINQSWRLRYPGKPFDCEGLFVWQQHGYVVSKVLKDARAEIYRFPLAEQQSPTTLEFVAQLRIDSPVTGADLSANGELLAVVSKAGAFLFQVNGTISRAGAKKPFQTRFRHEEVEGCTFVPEGLLATAESREIFLFTDPMFRPR